MVLVLLVGGIHEYEGYERGRGAYGKFPDWGVWGKLCI